jgi:hypothetical protein
MHAGFAFRNNDNKRHATSWYWCRLVRTLWLLYGSPTCQHRTQNFWDFLLTVAPMGKALYVTDIVYNLRGLQVAYSGQFSDNGCVSVASQVAEGQDISYVPLSVFRYNSCEPKIGQDNGNLISRTEFVTLVSYNFLPNRDFHFPITFIFDAMCHFCICVYHCTKDNRHSACETLWCVRTAVSQEIWGRTVSILKINWELWYCKSTIMP